MRRRVNSSAKRKVTSAGHMRNIGASRSGSAEPRGSAVMFATSAWAIRSTSRATSRAIRRTTERRRIRNAAPSSGAGARTGVPTVEPLRGVGLHAAQPPGLPAASGAPHPWILAWRHRATGHITRPPAARSACAACRALSHSSLTRKHSAGHGSGPYRLPWRLGLSGRGPRGH